MLSLLPGLIVGFCCCLVDCLPHTSLYRQWSEGPISSTGRLTPIWMKTLGTTTVIFWVNQLPIVLAAHEGASSSSGHSISNPAPCSSTKERSRG